MKHGRGRKTGRCFPKEGREKTVERLQKDVVRLKSMVQYPEARDQYCRLLNVVSEMQETKAVYDKVLNNREVDFDDDMIDLEAFLDDDTLMQIASYLFNPITVLYTLTLNCCNVKLEPLSLYLQPL
ncbi:UNVERIFIED_CONTAM: Calmodulin-binding transcription activator 3 [Sesamum radiatum]|uniref:Calmodulin-binding transcription activator 3 n=1 Tax=Sesamum radiatum TaxID=300843 RepID=A0AAW2JGY3_SESRA